MSVNIWDVSSSKMFEWDMGVDKVARETTNSAGKVAGTLIRGGGCDAGGDQKGQRQGGEMGLSKFLMSGILVMESGGTLPAAALTHLTGLLDPDL